MKPVGCRAPRRRPTSNFIRSVANITGPAPCSARHAIYDRGAICTGTRGSPLRHDPPAAPAVRDELERILSSETFKRSERARELLSYLVAREQLGEAERLKGYAIAVDVFGKDSEFDSSTDAVVRVQAGRLRELLSQYYAAEGRGDPIRMVIPRGSYVPAYEDMPAERPTQIPSEAARTSAGDGRAAATSRSTAGPNKPPSPKLGVGIGPGPAAVGRAGFRRAPACRRRLSHQPARGLTRRRPIPPLRRKRRCRPRPSPSGRRRRCRPFASLPKATMPATQRVAAEFKAAFSGLRYAGPHR